MSQEEDWKKGNFVKTSEPHDQTMTDSEKIYVIQKHDASNLHYDLRLEKEGVLKSWAVPKEPPASKGVKRLAMRVEDHPLDYASFEGEIPEGEYGAGKVEIWDKGKYSTEKWTEEEMVVHISGTRLNGRYCLIKFGKQGNSYLFFKCG